MKPLCVDFDGTIIEGDLLKVDLVNLIFRQPWLITKAFFHLVKGRNYLKIWLAEKFPLDLKSIHCREKVVKYLQKRKKNHGKVFLATASARAHAEDIARHLGFFNGVFATDDTVNLKSARKAQKLTQVFGTKGFDYLGDSAADLAVWRCCDQALVWGENPRFLDKVKAVNSSAKFLFNDGIA